MDELRLRSSSSASPVGDLLRGGAVARAIDALDVRGAGGGADDRGAGTDREPRAAGARSGVSSTPRAPEDEDTLDVFLQQIALVADADSRSEDEGLVTLMTLHNAKGLEYPIVFIVGCEDGVFPHSRALDEGGLEEERRLFYVGVTRAKRELYLDLRRGGARVRRTDPWAAQPLPGRDPRRAARPRAGAGAALPARRARRRGRRRRRGRPRGSFAPAAGRPRAAHRRDPPGRRFAWARTSCTPPSAMAWSPGWSRAG